TGNGSEICGESESEWDYVPSRKIIAPGGETTVGLGQQMTASRSLAPQSRSRKLGFGINDEAWSSGGA
ncbi:MAG TPA: hypothetical protein VKT80_15175, partial [Chloroflexota bacterium]|nr:hypothetical protein [Chloroflexota bacterium]